MAISSYVTTGDRLMQCIRYMRNFRRPSQGDVTSSFLTSGNLVMAV